MYFVVLLSIVYLLGVVGVVSNPSPYLAAGALMVAAWAGCGILAGMSMGFLALILLLVYLGGMLVVFAYSSAISSDVYPKLWGSSPIKVHVYVYLFIGMAVFIAGVYFGAEVECAFVVDGLNVLDAGCGGVSVMYSVGGGNLLVLGVCLLLALFVVLELVRWVLK